MFDLPRHLAAKFVPRPEGPNTLERGRVLELLERNAHAKLVLVHAPAGYGKSTFMAQWYRRLRQSSQGVGWMVVDEDDNDPSHLVEALGHALAPSGNGVDLIDAVNGCLQVHARYTLFIDDEERLVSPEARQLIGVLLNLSPPDLHLVIGCRMQPPHLLPRWRVRDDYVEITARELAFDPAEISEYILQRCHLALDQETVRYLAQRTEGWPAALQLAATEIGRGTPIRKLFEQGATASTNLFQYLSDEVMIHLRPEQTEFMLQTGFIGELSASLCDAVTGRSDSARSLWELLQANLPLHASTTDHEIFRYHPLFAEFLRRQLQLRHPGMLSRLARRASEWCSRSGQRETAVEYALLSDDPGHLLACIRACIEAVILRGQSVTARRWLDSVPPEFIGEQPDILFWNAWLKIGVSDFGGAQRILIDLDRFGSRTGRPDREFLRMMLDLAYGRFDAVAAVAAVLESEADPADLRIRIGVSNTQAMLHLMRGRLSDASQKVEESMAMALIEPVNWVGYVHACYNSAWIEFTLGNLTGALRLLEQSERFLERRARESEPGKSASLLLARLASIRALVLYELDRLEDAEDTLERAAPVFNSIFMPSGRALWYVVRARLYALRAEEVAYEETLREAIGYSAQHGIHWLRALVLWEHIEHDMSRGDIHRARALAGNASGQMQLAHPADWTALWEDRFGSELSALRLMILTGEASRALELLPVHIRQAEQQLRRIRLVRLRVLEALALDCTDVRSRAIEALGRAVEIAQPTGAIRVFVDEGKPCLELLRELQADQVLPPEQAEYIRALIGHFDDDEGAHAGSLSADAGFPVPLSTRELQILKRLAEGHSNLAMGQQLFLSTNTVKWHLSQIYAKLGVRNRTQAVHVARQHNWGGLQ